MKIVIKNGYQYFDLGDGMLALVMDDNGDPVEAEAKEWVETVTEYVLFPLVNKTKMH